MMQGNANTSVKASLAHVGGARFAYAGRFILPVLLLVGFAGLIRNRVYGEDVGLGAFLFFLIWIGCVITAAINMIALLKYSPSRKRRLVYFALLGCVGFLLFHFSPQLVIWAQAWRVQHEDRFIKCRELAAANNESYRICDFQDTGGAVVSNEFRYFVYDASDEIQGAPCSPSAAWEMIAKKNSGLSAYQSEIIHLADHFYLAKIRPSLYPLVKECSNGS